MDRSCISRGRQHLCCKSIRKNISNKYGENDWKIIGSEIYNGEYARSWGNAVLGADKCIYFSPLCHDRVLRYNPTTQSISLIGESYGGKECKWEGAVLASDGFIYCVPNSANEILQIDSRHVNEKVIDIIDNIDKGHEYMKNTKYIRKGTTLYIWLFCQKKF